MMMRRPVIALCLAVILLLSGCAGSGKHSVPNDAPMAAAADTGMFMADVAAEESVEYGNSASQSAPAEQPADAGTRKIVYTADLTLTADDPAAALKAVTQKALSLGGYVAASYTRNDDLGARRASATLKVPAASLNALVTAAEDAGTVDDYSLNSDDISLSYYDIQARLTSAQAEETQLLEILSTCTSVEDVLAVRSELAGVRSDIESYQGQIRLWDELVDYATLELSINRTEQTPVEGEGTLITIWKASDVWKKIARGFQNSLRFIVNAVSAIGIFLAIAIVPAAILFCCIGIPLIVRHKRKKRKAAAQTGTQTKE